MKYFIYENGQQQGPFDIEQLKEKGINGEILVWCENMSNWDKAKNVPELSSIILPTPPPIGNYNSESQEYKPAEPCPDNNMGFAIASTILTFFGCYIIGSAIGIIAIVFASKVKSYWQDGFYDEAKEYARKAKIWAIIGIVLPITIWCIFIITFIISHLTTPDYSYVD